MTEVLVMLALLGAAVVAGSLARRAARRRSRARAEAVLDDLASRVCAALAGGASPRAADRALARYARARDRVAAARTCTRLEALVLEHRLRAEARRLGGRASAGARARMGAALAPRRGGAAVSLTDAVAAAAGDAARDLAARPPGPGDDGRAALRRALARALAGRAGRRFTVIPEDNARLRTAPAGVVPVDIGVRGRLGGRHRALVACGWLGGEAGVAAARDAAWGAAAAAEEARAEAWLVTAGPSAQDAPLGGLVEGVAVRASLDPGLPGWEVAARRLAAG